MSSLVGFSLYYNVPIRNLEAALVAEHRIIDYFSHLTKHTLTIGTTRLDLWGHNPLAKHIHTMPDGSVLALIGSPHSECAWTQIQEKLLKKEKRGDFDLPWEGRVILLCISADGGRWTMWNDWMGSIPVFHAEIGVGRVASTLEPVVVTSAGYDHHDFFLPGLVSLLLNGHYLSDWTLYKNMKVVPPDSEAVWNENGFHVDNLHTVEPSQSRWEVGWDDLVDEMHELSHRAISGALKAHPKWTLPLSSGLDSRLIAGVAAEIGSDAKTYAWGASNTTDVVYSRQIAQALGFPWKRIDLPRDFLVKHTPQWAKWFGSAMHFHGMYQMAFLDEIRAEPATPVISGYIGDVLAGDSVKDLSEVHSSGKSYQLESDWYSHWTVKELRAHAKFPLEDALEANAVELKRQVDSLPGAFYQKMQFLELWNRQRHFTSFQSILSDYWRGVANPFMDRAYARFCLSLPRIALDYRRLLSGVFRRYYGRLAVIPGTYAPEPYILTGRYLIMRKVANILLPAFHKGPLKGFGNVQLRMDIASLQSSGRESLSPLFDVMDHLSRWFDVGQLERDYQAVMNSRKDIRPLRRLQSVQTLAHRLILAND